MKRTCPTCHGRGRISASLPLPMLLRCARCEGRGTLEESLPVGLLHLLQTWFRHLLQRVRKKKRPGV